MTLILVKNKNVLDIPSLYRFALRYIYDLKSMKAEDVALMQQSIINWKDHLRLQRELGFNAIDEDNEYYLGLLCNLLLKNEKGELEDRKRLFYEYDINYEKFHRVPGSVTQEDIYKGNLILEEHKRTNPEDYK